MPNWSCTNIVAKGERKQLERLASDLNNMPSVRENHFGRLWLGNFVAMFLNNVKNDSLLQIIQNMMWERLSGIISPNFYSVATLGAPDTEEEIQGNDDGNIPKKFEIEDDCLRFSIISAWEKPNYILNLIERGYGVKLYWSTTDEMYSFSSTYNPDKIPELPYVYFDGVSYSRLEIDELKEQLKNHIEGLEIPENADTEYFISDEFLDMYSKLPEKVTSPALWCDIDTPLFEVYKEVDLSYWQ